MSESYRAPVRAGIQSGRFPVKDQRRVTREAEYLRPTTDENTATLRAWLQSRGKDPDAYWKKER